MHFDNNATRTRRELLIKVARLVFQGNLMERIDRIPLEMRPKNEKSTRCCIHKDRAVLKYRLMGILGFKTEDETDELMPLKDYAQKCLELNGAVDNILSVIDEACTACIQSRYFVTNACRGCMARPCMVNCPKKAIKIGTNSQAEVDPATCVNCGLCLKACPYHAIIRIPVPCEEACPVGAIEKDCQGKATIDHNKCILCGKCMRECPFGAIMECSQFVNVINALVNNKSIVLMIAPVVAGQFVAEFSQLISAVRKVGFTNIVEVALGAKDTALHEAAEFEERIGHGDKFMTTSCCPAYTDAVEKHIPALKNRVSTTRTPLHYTAELVASRFPDSIKIFVSPCIAKRQEVVRNNLVDMVLTCEELGAIIAAKGIDVAECETDSEFDSATKGGRGFPFTGGVTDAVKKYLKEPDKIKPQFIDGLSKQNIKLLKIYSGPKGVPGANFLEVMSCEGGCVNGPCTMENPALAKKRISNLMELTPE
jgi:[FeFe] hydrogenase (group B1/B3)